MSMVEYEHAKTLIGANAGADFVGGREENLVVAAEIVLSVKFSPTYRRFLREFGCGYFLSEEFYGIVDADLFAGPVPNGIWVTITQRQAMQLEPSLVIVQSGGDGTWCAIDTARRNDEGESPVVRLNIDCRPFEQVAEDFGRFLLDRVLFALEPDMHGLR
jgi:antitoxin YobK